MEGVLKTPNSWPFKWQVQHKIESGPFSYSALVLHHEHLVIARLYEITVLFSALWFLYSILIQELQLNKIMLN